MKPLPFASTPLLTSKGVRLVSFNDIAKLFQITPAKLRAEFCRSLVPLPPVTLAPKDYAGPVSKAGWYNLSQVKRWRADAGRAKRLVVSE